MATLYARADTPAWVLDAGGKSIARLDVQRGTIEAKIPLPFRDDPTELIATPDGKHLVVLSPGKGRRFSDAFRPEGNGSAVIVDTATLSATPRIDLGRGAGDVVFSRDGQSVYVLSPGYGDAAGVLSRIDLDTGAVLKRVTLDRAVDRFGAVSGDTAVVFEKGKKPMNGRLSFVSLESLDVTATVQLSGREMELVEMLGSGYLYAVGSSTVDVVSIPERKIAATLPVGRDAKVGGIDEATRSVFVLASDDKRNGMLYVLRGASLAGSSSTGTGAPEIFRLSSDGKRAFIGNARRVTEVSLAPQIAAGTTAPLYSGLRAVNMQALDAAVTADGRRVLLLMREGDKCCTLSIADPNAGSKVASMGVGRKSRRVVQGLFALAATAASFSSGRSYAKAHGGGSFTYSIYSPAGSNNPRGAFAFTGDGKTVYIPDSGTDTVTIVDVESGNRIADLDGPDAVNDVLLLGGRTVVASGEKGFSLIESASNTVAQKIDLQGELHDVVVTPDGATALALSKGDLSIIDGRATKVTTHVAGLIDPVAVAFVGK
jgi:DNA-binding beta-propeller fold protein YncE